MAIKTKEEILNQIKEKLGEDTSDESLAIIEDVSDTLEDFSSKASGSTDWEKKYKENDEMWRKKYRDRFMGKSPDSDEHDNNDEPIDPPERKTFESLFETFK